MVKTARMLLLAGIDRRDGDDLLDVAAGVTAENSSFSPTNMLVTDGATITH